MYSHEPSVIGPLGEDARARRIIGADRSRLRTAPSRSLAVLLSLLLAALPACSAFDEHRESLEQLHAAGAYERAYERLDEPETRDLYDAGSSLLWWLDRGALALATDRPDEAVVQLDVAEGVMRARRDPTLAESLGVAVVSDRLGPYLGEPYEDMYTNVLKMLAHLEAGRVVGGATVEARRMATKANSLRDAYLERIPVLKRETSDLEASVNELPSAQQRLFAADSDGRFVESPLGVFLTAFAFMHADDPANQRVAARRLQEIIDAQAPFIGPVDPERFEGLGQASPEQAGAVVVAFSGRGPTKVAAPFGPIALRNIAIYFELPLLHWTPSLVDHAVVEVRPAGSTAAEPPELRIRSLALVEDLASVANENHRRRLPEIYLRTLLRAGAKTTGIYFASEAASRSADDDLAGLAVVLGGLLLQAATEQADLRSWAFLPGQAHVTLLDLPPGEHEARVVYLDAQDRVLHTTAWEPLRVGRDAPGAIVTHFWR